MLNITKIRKYIKGIEESKRKVVTVFLLSKNIGIKEEIIKEDLVNLIPLINFDDSLNLKDYLTLLKDEEEKINEGRVVKKRIVKNNEAKEYENAIDYIYKNFCVEGGVLDLGYQITKKDIKILNKLLKEEKENLDKMK